MIWNEVISLSLLQMSLSGGIFIMAVVFIRAVTINRLPKKTFLVLWELVLLRLLIPVSVPSRFSLYTILPKALQTKTPVLMPVISHESFETAPKDLAFHPAQPVPIWIIIWCIGMIFCFVFFAIFYLRCRIEFLTSCPVQDTYAIQWLREHPLKRPLAIRESDRISTPLTYGVLRPVILMPHQTDWKDISRLQYILLHEFVHIRRFDTVVKLIMTGALCLHWFNPMVWAMYILMNRDLELSCDESVIQHFGESSKPVYARILIDMKAQKGCPAPLCNSFNNNAIEERIIVIMKMKRKTTLSILIACFIIVAAAGIFATSAAASDPQTEIVFRGNQAATNDYAVYAPFGLTVISGKLYYEDKPVRCFDDQYPAKNLSIKAIGYYEETGITDIRAVRDENNTLTGLEESSPEEFQNREIVIFSQQVADDPQTVITYSSYSSGNDGAMFSDYQEYGLHYDESEKALFYDGKRVRVFWDSFKSASQPDDSETALMVSVSNWDNQGEIDLYAIRDFKQKDDNGYGKLTGLRQATQEEFEKNTKAFQSQSGSVEIPE